jgi:hypothetical protein
MNNQRNIPHGHTTRIIHCGKFQRWDAYVVADIAGYAKQGTPI